MGLTTRKIVLKDDQKLFFISDTHYNHKNICRGTTSWDLKEHGGHNSVRDFNTVPEMNLHIVNAINAVVKEDDYLVHLGDWSFGGIQSIWEFRSRIICKNVILVLGNHDEHIDANKVLPNVVQFIDFANYPNGDEPFKTVSKGDTLIHPYREVRAQDIFQGVYGRLSLSVTRPDGSKMRYECNHFPWTVWDKAHHGRIHLYGHVHGNYTNPSRALDVGIDNIKKIKGNFEPFSEKEISKYMKGRIYQKVSHHNKNTN